MATAWIPVSRDLFHDVRNERLPVAHCDVHRRTQFVGEQLALARRDFVHRGMADERIAMLDLIDHWGGRGGPL